MYIYESHLGGLYTSDEYLDYDYLYCEDCGDSDYMLGEVNNRQELEELLKNLDYDLNSKWAKEFLAQTFPNDKEKKEQEKLAEKHKFPRKPKVSNRYKLTPKLCTKLKINDDTNIKLLEENGFWRNEIIDAWCLSYVIGEGDFEDAEYWLGFYDKNAKSNKGKTKLHFSCQDGMCSYTFEKFFDFNEIDNRFDLEIQEAFIQKINYLLDRGILWLED